MTDSTSPRLNPLHLVAAFGTGCLLTLMVHFNGELGRYGNALFASWAAHGTGTVAALVFLGLLWARRKPAPATESKPRAPWWAYLGGLSGAITVILTSITVNSPLALSGTLALGLAEVVTARAGGVRLDTLFIDEGFGSLDDDTLELAMRTLDELRQGGRTVGLISHVAAMKEQLPAQLAVEATPQGPSVIRQEAALPA